MQTMMPDVECRVTTLRISLPADATDSYDHGALKPPEGDGWQLFQVFFYEYDARVVGLWGRKSRPDAPLRGPIGK